MKKNTLLLALLIISSFGFSQDKSNIDDAFLRRFPSISQPLSNLENINLIDKTNKLECEYLNLKAKEVQYEFVNQDLIKLKTEEEVFKAYINYLKTISIPPAILEERILSKNGIGVSIGIPAIATASEAERTSGINRIVNKNRGSQEIINAERNPYIDQINKLEFEYLNLKTNEIQNSFTQQDLSKLKTKDEVFEAYIAYLKKKISKNEKKLKMQGNQNANRFDFGIGSKMKINRLEKSEINNMTTKK